MNTHKTGPSGSSVEITINRTKLGDTPGNTCDRRKIQDYTALEEIDSTNIGPDGKKEGQARGESHPPQEAPSIEQRTVERREDVRRKKNGLEKKNDIRVHTKTVKTPIS